MLSDRHHVAVYGNRMPGGGEAQARQASVEQRRLLLRIDVREDRDGAVERIGIELAAGDVCDAPVALDEDRVGAVDHDFLHIWIRKHGLQRTEVVVQYLKRVFIRQPAHRMPPHVRGWNSFVISPEAGAPC